MTQFDVIGIGQVCMDFLGMVKGYPGVEGRVELEEMQMRAGGPTATALMVLSRFGAKVSLIGKVGDDDIGRKLSQELENSGVDCSHLIVEPGKSTQVSFIPVESESGRRTVFWSRGSAGPIKPEELNKGAISGAKAVHFDELFIEAAAEAAQIAKNSGILVSMDAGSAQEGIEKLKGKVDLFIASESFMIEYSGQTDPKRGVVSLRDFRAPVTAVTMGERGSLTLYNDDFIETPSYKIQALDTTGAGDAFHGAFLYGWLAKWEIRQALNFASAAAAMNCLGRGASGGIPGSVKDVFDFMKNGVKSAQSSRLQ